MIGEIIFKLEAVIALGINITANISTFPNYETFPPHEIVQPTIGQPHCSYISMEVNYSVRIGHGHSLLLLVHDKCNIHTL